MAKKNKIVVDVEANTSKLDAALEASEGAVDNLGRTGQRVVGALDNVTGGFASRLVESGAGIRQLISGLNATKVALAATGIGLFVTAIGSLIAYFTQTERGAEMLERATAGVGAVFRVLIGVVSSLGEGIVNLFTKPKETITQFATLIKTYVTDQFQNILSGVSDLADAVGKVFSGDFKGAAESAKAGFSKVGEAALKLNPITGVAIAVANGVGQIATEAGKAATAAAGLTARMQDLEDAQIDQIAVTAKANAEIRKLRFIADDETKSIEERIAAVEKATKIEQNAIAQRKAIARENLAILTEQNRLAEAAGTLRDEDRRAAAEAQAEIYQLDSESYALKKRLQGELQSLRNQAQAQTDAANKANEEKQKAVDEAERKRATDQAAALIQIEDALWEQTATDIDREVKAIEEKYNTLEALAIANGLSTTEIEAARIAEIDRLEEEQRVKKAQADQAARDAAAAADDAAAKKRQDDADKQAATDKAVYDSRKAIAFNTLEAIAALSDAFTKGDERRAKRNFQINKAIGIANAVINTAEGVTAALTDKTQPSTILRLLQTASVAAVGAAQIATIAKQKFESPSPDLAPPSTAGVGGGGSMAPSIDLGFMGQANQTQGIRSYVLASEVSTAQQANQRISDQAKLFG
jgi:hypothetical protein